MKWFFLLFFLFFPPLSSAWADNGFTPPQPNSGNWVYQMNGQMGFPTGNLNNVASQGWGGEAAVGYRLPQNISFLVEGGYAGYTSKNGAMNTTWGIVPLVAKVQYNFSDDAFQPYVFISAGVAFNSKSFSLAGLTYTSGENDFLEEGGLGAAFYLIPQFFLYVQTKVEIDNTTAFYAGDQPTVLIPIDFGLSFLVN